MSNLSGAVLLLLLAAAAAACQVRESEPRPSAAADCRRYDPVVAKRTFDGRVGNIAFRNAATRPVTVTVYHPDGDGSVEVRWTVPPDTVANLGGGFGNDWGIRADTSCITTLGRVGQWSDGRFAIAWRSSALVAGDSSDVPTGGGLRADEPL